MTPDPFTHGSPDRPTVVLQCLADRPTVVDNLRVGGSVVIDPANPLLLRPGDRLRLVVDRPGRARGVGRAAPNEGCRNKLTSSHGKAAVMNTPPEVLAANLFAPGRLPPVADSEGALDRIRYGLSALTEAPAGGLTPADRLADEPVFRAGLDMVDRFLDLGRWPEPGVVGEMMRAVCDRLGPGVSGTAAAATGVCLLAQAVERLHADPPDFAGAAAVAEEAADCAARAGDAGYTYDALTYLERLQMRMYGLPRVRLDRPGRSG